MRGKYIDISGRMNILNEANEYILKHKDEDGIMPPDAGGTDGMLHRGCQLIFIGLLREYVMSINQRVINSPVVIEEE